MPITMDRFSNRSPSPDPGGRADLHRGGSPRNADWQDSDADVIGIDPVHIEWTVVDGCQVPTLLMIAIVSLAL